MGLAGGAGRKEAHTPDTRVSGGFGRVRMKRA